MNHLYIYIHVYICIGIYVYRGQSNNYKPGPGSMPTGSRLQICAWRQRAWPSDRLDREPGSWLRPEIWWSIWSNDHFPHFFTLFFFKTPGIDIFLASDAVSPPKRRPWGAMKSRISPRQPYVGRCSVESRRKKNPQWYAIENTFVGSI